MNSNHLQQLFNENILSDISIILKDSNQSVNLNAHKNILVTNNYFKKMFTGPLKEKYTNELVLEVFDVNICRDIIMSFYGIVIDPVKFSDHRYTLEYIKCCDYWLVPYEGVLTDDLKVPEEDFDLLLEVAELINYSDLVLKIIARNIPLEYDLTGIPNELKERMIKLEQIDCIVSCNDDNGIIKIWDLHNGTKIKSLNDNVDTDCLCYIQEKNQIASGGSGTIKIWDLNSNVVIKTLKGHRGLVVSVCNIPGKNQIASGSTDNTIKIWDLDTGTVVKTLNGHTNSVLSVCYISEKNQIVSGSADHTIKIWDLNIDAEIKSFKGHNGSVFSVCYISEKNQIASGSDDNTIKIWDLESGEVVKTLTVGYYISELCHIKMNSNTAKRLKN